RIRADKHRPNHRNIAVDVWDDIHHPIEPETLQGRSLVLSRAAFNRIKRALYDSIPSNKTLLDIGGGNGGDISKWGRYRRVVSVEPKEKNRQEFTRRVQLQGMTEKVRLVAAGGEETEVITSAGREFLGP